MHSFDAGLRFFLDKQSRSVASTLLCLSAFIARGAVNIAAALPRAAPLSRCAPGPGGPPTKPGGRSTKPFCSGAHGSSTRPGRRSVQPLRPGSRRHTHPTWAAHHAAALARAPAPRQPNLGGGECTRFAPPPPHHPSNLGVVPLIFVYKTNFLGCTTLLCLTKCSYLWAKQTFGGVL